jgi:hypothetical protein
MHTESQLAVFKLQMGLGKTLQTISLLAYLRESRGVRGPHIVIVPKSVVGNWIREFKKWCPCIKAVKMGGTKEERQKVIAEDLPLDPVTGKHKFDVLVTSYEGLLREKGKCHRATVPPCHRAIVPSCHGATVPSYHHVTMVPWYHGARKKPPLNPCPATMCSPGLQPCKPRMLPFATLSLR